MLIQANCSHTLPLKDSSVQCIITSPPYYALRNYGVAGQLGLESTWREWLDAMVAVFMECHRVLRPDGVLWLNVGDKYCSNGGRGRGGGSARVGRTREQRNPVEGKLEPGFKYKDLMGLPWRLAIALQDRGWWLRRDLIWNKPTAMPESVRDRCPTSHEYIFQFAKSGYYYWMQKNRCKEETSPCWAEQDQYQTILPIEDWCEICQRAQVHYEARKAAAKRMSKAWRKFVAAGKKVRTA